MIFSSMHQLEEHVLQNVGSKKTAALVEASDEHALEAVRDAKRSGLVTPLLFGNKQKIEEKLRLIGESTSDYEIVHRETPEESALAAGIATREKRADFIVKGAIQTATLLKSLFNEATAFRTGRLISHMNVLEIRNYHKLVALCDSSINIAPNQDQKKDILVNAVEALQRMGISMPKVAVLSSAETLNEKMPESVDAFALKQMNQCGEITGCIVEGPISYDLAMSRESADIKGYESPVSGDTDLLVCPGIVTANVLIKCLRHSAEALTAGIVVGGSVPVVLTSRASSAEDKYRTMVLASSACS